MEIGRAGTAVIIIERDPPVGIAGEAIDHRIAAQHRADAAADIEVAARIRAQPVSGDGEAANAFVGGRIGDLAIDAEHRATGPDVIADAGAIEQAIAVFALDMDAVITDDAFHARSGERRTVLGVSGRGDGAGEKNGDEILGHKYSIDFIHGPPACGPLGTAPERVAVPPVA